MRTFRQKAFTSYLILLLVFLGLMFPFISNSVQQIVFRSMRDRADELIQKLVLAKDDVDLVEMIKTQKPLFFYRIGILDNERRLLYDSHTKRLLGSIYFPLQFITHPEIEEALEYGAGYSEEYSHLLGQKLIYVAKRFDFHGKPYVLRLAFPFKYIQDLREDFTIGFLFFGSLVLVLFAIMTALVLNHLSSPIREIINSIRGFNEGKLETLPIIQLTTPPQDDFTHLANTINTLSQRVRSEIATVTKERNDRDIILETLSDGVIALTPSNTVSYANKNASLLLGIQETLQGHLFPNALLPKCFEVLHTCRTNNSITTQPIEIGYGIKKRFLHLVAIPRSSKGDVILVIQDTSLQQRVIEMRKAFIAHASHELKTPITVIRGFAETLQDHPELPQDTVAIILEKIVSNCWKMTSIIKNLLTLADIENLPAFRVLPTNILSLINKTIETTLSIYTDADIQVHTIAPENTLTIDIDEELMEVAFSNLLDNAAKYSHGPAKIDISIQKKESMIELSFTDQGIGIPEADIKNIFQRFYRVNKAHTKQIGGSGLGLSIVETIISKHLGSIEVTSTLGKGSTFIIHIPYRLRKLLTFT